MNMLKFWIENIKYCSEKYLKHKIFSDWSRGALSMPDRENPNFNNNFKRLYKVRDQIIADHIKRLSPEEQDLINNGLYPSQSHKYSEIAKTYADDLCNELKHIDYVESVTLGYYHSDIIVLDVRLSKDPGQDRIIQDIPYLYKGFMVKIVHRWNMI